MLGSNSGQLRLRHWMSDALANRLHLIHIGYISSTSATSHPQCINRIEYLPSEDPQEKKEEAPVRT